MTMLTHPERRQFERYPVRLPVTVVACEGAIIGVRGHTVDISRQGLRVVTEADLQHGVEQTLMIDVTDGQIIARAAIVRTERRGDRWVHGLLIAEIEAADELRLTRICAATPV